MTNEIVFSVTAQIIIGLTVFAGTFLLCHLSYQKRKLAQTAQKLTGTLQQYQELFQGKFPKHIRVREAPDPKPVFEIRRLDDTKAGGP